MNKNWKANIALFLSGQGLSMFGSMLVQYAIMWHITLETQSGAIMTLFAVAGTLPMFFISPFAGVWADKYNRKYIINIADASITVVTLIMALLFSVGVDSMAMMLICVVIRSLGQGVQSPAVSALLPQLVPEEQLARVNGINGSIQSLTMIAAPMTSGALLTFAPLQTLLYIDVVTAAIGISIMFFFVKVPKRTIDKALDSAKSYFHDIRAGVKYILGHAFVKKFLMLAAVFYVVAAPAAMLTPLHATRDFGDDVWRLTAIEISFASGMMLSGILMGVWGGFKNKSHTMTLAFVMFGVFTLGLGIMQNFWLYLGCMAMVGISMPLFSAPLMTILQVKVDPDYMGRVFSVMSMIGSVMMPLGMAIFGPLGDVIHLDWLMLSSGIAIVVLGFVFISIRDLPEAGHLPARQPAPEPEG